MPSSVWPSMCWDFDFQHEQRDDDSEDRVAEEDDALEAETGLMLFLTHI